MAFGFKKRRKKDASICGTDKITESLLEKQLEYQKRLNQITNWINSATNTDDILLNIQKEILGLFDAERITLYMVDGIRKQIVSKFKTGEEINEIRVPINNESIAGYCAWSGKMINILDVYDQNELSLLNPRLRFDKTWDQKTGFKTTQVLTSPIIHNRLILGVIQLINKQGTASFTEEDQNSLKDITEVLGIAFFKNQTDVHREGPTKFDFLIKNNIISGKDLTDAMSLARRRKRALRLF